MPALLLLMAKKLVVMIACHFIGDYPLQMDWMAKLKGKDSHALFAHVMTYTSVFALLMLVPWMDMSIQAIALICVSHAIIDPLKARWKLFGLFVDQSLHIGILIFCVLMGWV